MADSVTISLLPVSLALVHIPRPRVPALVLPVLRQLLLPKPTFLNLTANEIELSIFADHAALADFAPVARRDARRARSLARAQAKQNGNGDEGEDEDGKRTRGGEPWAPVEVAHDRWNVLQIDSHSDSLDTSGARVHELSAPLAAAGISILYQSSYMSDFIFVKEHCLAEVMSLLGAAGFDLYSSDPEHLTSQLSTLASPSPLLSPLPDDADAPIRLLELAAPAPAPPISPESGAVLSRSRSGTDASRRASPRARGELDRERETGMTGADGVVVLECDAAPPAVDDAVKHGQARARTASHSPAGGDVRVLAPALTSIGLADEHADAWGLKIVKLVAYPGLITGPHVAPASSVGADVDGVEDDDVDDEVGNVFYDEGTYEDEDEDEDDVDDGRSDDTTRVGDSPVDRGLDSDPDHDPDFRASSASPEWDAPAPAPGEDADTVAGECEGGDEDEDGGATPHPVGSARPVLPRLDTDRTSTPARKPRPSPPYSKAKAHAHAHPRLRSRHTDRKHPAPPPPLVPFFSFTRTPEGSSLTAPVPLLAMLFPRGERHMVLCSGELDGLDSRGEGTDAREEVGEESGDTDGGLGDGEREGDGGDEEEEVSASEGIGGEETGTLKCLQIDLRKFGLDKHGLVNRYSRTLEAHGINHMYSSTYKTANLLVDRSQARRARALLRAC